MMSERIKDALNMASIAIDGLEVIANLTGIGDDKAPAALATIDKIVSALRDGLDGRTSPEIVAHELRQLRDALAANNAMADKALADKFKDG